MLAWPSQGLDVDDVGMVFEGVGRGCGTQGVQAQPIEADAGFLAAPLQLTVNPVADKAD